MAKVSALGVCLLLFTREATPRMFVVRELKSKPHYRKVAGMVSFPIETHEVHDVSVEGTIRRLVREEVGVPLRQVALCRMESQRFRFLSDREDVEWCYGWGFFDGDPSQLFTFEDTDVVFEGWRTVDELLAEKHVRIEVVPILEHFKNNHYEDLLRQVARTVS